MQAQCETHETDSTVDDINARLNDFDVMALLRLLKFRGFKEKNWWFSSHNNIVSQNRLIHSVSLNQDQVLIEMNMGILASTGIIPEHIRKFMDHPDVDDLQLQHFLALFDHILISSYLAQLYPQINSTFFGHFSQTQTLYTRLQNMRREISLHWLLNTAFPECYVDIVMAPDTETECHCRPILGRMTLGQGSDKLQRALNNSLTVTLTLRPEWNDLDFSWQSKMQLRIREWVLPWLQDFSMKVTFMLRRPQSQNSLKLHQHSVLGYDPFLIKSHLQNSRILVSNSFSVLLYKQTLPILRQSFQALSQWEESWRIRL